MNAKQRTASADPSQQQANNTLNNGLIGNVIDSNLPYFTWDDLSQRSDHPKDQCNRTNRRAAGQSAKQPRIDLTTSGSSDDVLLTGASASPTGSVLENQCTKNQTTMINNNNHHFNSNLSANYQNFHADRELEEEVELFEHNQAELREQDDEEADFEVEEDEDQLNDEILAGYTRNGTLQSNNYMHNTALGQRLLLMDQSARSTATSMQQPHYTGQSMSDANRTLADDGSTGGITNAAFIGLHSCYGYPKCENLTCGNFNKAHLTANLGDHIINTSSSSWFSVSSQSRAICSLGCCAILTTCLFILLAIVSVVGISIYLSNITNQNKSNVLPLSGRFKVQLGDQFTELLHNTSSREFQLKATKYEAIVSTVLFF